MFFRRFRKMNGFLRARPPYCGSHCQGCVKWWQRANRLAGVGHCECHFAGQAQYLVQIRSVWNVMRDKHSNSDTLIDTLHFTLYTVHSTLDTFHSSLYTPHSTLYTPHLTLYTPHSTLYTPHFRLHTLHFRLHTLHSTLYTFAIHTLHFTLDSPHFTLHTLHSTLYTLHFTLYTSQSTVYTPHLTLDTLHSTLYTPHFTLYTWHSTFHTLHFTLHTLHFCNPHFTFYTWLSTLYTSHSTLHTLHFTLHTLHFTVYSLHSTLDTWHFTLYTLHSTLYTLHSTLDTWHFTLCISQPRTLHFTLYTLHSRIPNSHSIHSTFPNQDSTFFTLHTLHSTPFHIPQSTVHWCGAVTGENIYKTNQIIRFTKCFTWLHSSSWAASCLITMSVVHCTALRNKFYWTLDEFASTCSCDTTFKHLKTGWGNEQITCHCWFASCFVQGWTQSMVSLFFLVIAPLYLPAASVFHSTFGVGQGRNQSKTSDSPWHEKVSSAVVLKLKHVWLQAHR